MRRGGEADKLGNAYEGLWTVYNELDVLRGRAREITVEPLQDAQGVEFVKLRNDETAEFHSVKIQTTKPVWSLPMLTAKNKDTGRSILGDLIAKLRKDMHAQCRFVSEVTANPLKLICDDAAMAADLPSFRARLGAARLADLQKFILPMFGNNEDAALAALKRLRVVSMTGPELVDVVEREVITVLYRPDGNAVDPGVVRLLTADFVLHSLGKRVRAVDLLEMLEKEGFCEAAWSRDKHVLERITAQNESYYRSVRGQLINGANIHRQEAEDAFKIIVDKADRVGAFVGVAGLGKSCAAAELLDYIRGSSLPFIALRLDESFAVATPRQLGLSLDFPMSPVDLLAAVAEGGPCVLLLDQLDALSIISGRQPGLWKLVDALIEETRRYPNMRVWLACRAFDLEHDPRLRQLFEREKTHAINLRLLSAEEVLREVSQAGVSTNALTPSNIEVLRTPMHLSLYLEGNPGNKPPFKSVQDLYRNYWDRKYELVRDRLGRDPHWTQVIDLMCDKLSGDQVLAVSRDYVDDGFRSDALAMVSENVLACDKDRYRFFHETFFDYAFARRFVRRGKRLIDLLLHEGEQHLFRRSQVRQILSYLRGEDRTRYLDELKAVLHTPGVRTHIVKLVLDWLNTVPDPSTDELALLQLP
jgi:hypothetical protein